ncbi:MAG: hypothetical protein ACREDU_10510, partial [Methylocella sp.]
MGLATRKKGFRATFPRQYVKRAVSAPKNAGKRQPGASSKIQSRILGNTSVLTNHRFLSTFPLNKKAVYFSYT